MIELFAILLGIGILVSGALAVLLDNIIAAVVSAGLASLFAAVTYVLLAAPDVAMTEAAIGSGLTTFLFFFVLGRVRRGEND